MEILTNPNISYLLLVVGIFLGVLAVVTPGTGMLEVGTVFMIALAGYGAYHLGVNTWALIVLLLAAVAYVYAVWSKKRAVFLAISILGLVGGSVFLYTDGWKPLVSPILALVVSVVSAGSMWIMIKKSLQAHKMRPRHDLGTLVGQVGEAKTNIHDGGSAQVAGELWTARSEKPVRAGAQVRVVGREGFVLLVEADGESKSK